MDDNRMVTIISTVNRTVVVNRPEYGIRRQWVAKGQAQQLPYDIVQNLMFTVGFQNLINDGTLYIPSMDDKKDLNIEDFDAEVPTRVIVLTDAQMAKLLSKEVSKEQFIIELSRLPMSQAHALIDYAVANEIVDSQKTQYLKELTGRDIVQIIARKRQSEEIDRQVAAREAVYKAENEGRKF